jgi:agmatine deiminase
MKNFNHDEIETATNQITETKMKTHQNIFRKPSGRWPRRVAILWLACALGRLAMAAPGQNPADFGYAVPAEWEPQESVWLAWPTWEPMVGTSMVPQVLTIIEAVTPHQLVDLIVNFEPEEAAARARLVERGIPLSRVRFRHIHHTDFWTRDVGAVFLRDALGRLAAVDLDFNSYGLAEASKFFIPAAQIEEKIDKVMAQQLGIPVFSSPLVLEGGGLEFNGRGTLLVTESVVLQPERNPGITRDQAEAELKRVFAVQKVIWLKNGVYADDAPFYGPIPGPNGPVIPLVTHGHTDEFVRWIDDHTVLLAEVTEAEASAAGPNSIAAVTRARMEENYQRLAQATTRDGQPITIVRIPAAEEMFQVVRPGDGDFDALIGMVRTDPGHEGEPLLAAGQTEVEVVRTTSYLNYFVANKVVLVAEYWRPGRPLRMLAKDQQARAILQAAFPDRTLIAIPGIEDVNLAGGGIHCITQQMPARKP